MTRSSIATSRSRCCRRSSRLERCLERDPKRRLRDIGEARIALEDDALRADDVAGSLAPNGRWFACMSDVTGDWEVYVRRLESGSPPVRVLSGGGAQPLWHPGGRELYYVDGAGRITAVAVTWTCLLYTSPSPRDRQKSRMPSSA